MCVSVCVCVCVCVCVNVCVCVCVYANVFVCVFWLGLGGCFLIVYILFYEYTQYITCLRHVIFQTTICI